MMFINSKKAKLQLSICILAMLSIPQLTYADTAIVLAEAETGSIAARQAADQKAALAKKAAERKAKKAAEAQAATEGQAQQAQEPAKAQQPVEEQKEK
jgi:hypothetical protein